MLSVRLSPRVASGTLDLGVGLVGPSLKVAGGQEWRLQIPLEAKLMGGDQGCGQFPR